MGQPTPLMLLIDAIGEARAQQAEAKEREEKLKPSLVKYNLGKGAHEGLNYVLTVGERIETTYSVEKVYKLLGIKKLQSVVKVLVGELKKHVTLSQLDGLAEGKPNTTTTFSFAKRK
jgi:hypothetical protein